MIIYINRAEATSLAALFRCARTGLNPVDRFFASRAITRIKNKLAADIAKKSVIDHSLDNYDIMLSKTPEQITEIHSNYRYHTYAGLRSMLDKLYKEDKDETDI